MEYWGNDHMDGGWGVAMALGMIGVWVALIALIVFAVVWTTRSTGTTPREPGTRDAEQILAERLARGEIDTDEYRARLTALTSRGGT